MGPLHGIRIIDLTTVMMGPSATQALGEMGADVIKVEAPAGDPVRQIGPNRNPGMGGLFINANGSKRSIGIDLKTEGGRATLIRLVAGADVFVYNVRPQAMARLGLSYEDVAAVKPDIVYAGMFGYGQDGPYATRPAYDDLIQGASLIPALIARAGDGTPRYVPAAIADRIVGISAVGAICAALLHRERTGEGQRIDVPMFETMVNFVLGDHMGGLTFDPPLDRGGYARLLTSQRQPYKTKNGYICALLYNDKQWQAFYDVMGRSDSFKDDPRLQTITSRTVHIDALYGEIAALFTERTTQEWMEVLEKADIPFVPFHDMETIFDDPHLTEIDFFTIGDHPSEGRIRRMRTPAKWSRTQTGQTRPAPRFSEHGKEILEEAGFTPAEIEDLFNGSAVLPA